METLPSQEGRQGRPLKFQTPRLLERKCKRYFAECDKKGLPYTISGLALYLDTSRGVLLTYENEETASTLTDYEKIKYSSILKRARTRIEAYAEAKLFGTAQCIGSIFWLKNNAGYTDRTETEIKGAVLPFQINIVKREAREIRAREAENDE